MTPTEAGLCFVISRSIVHYGTLFRLLTVSKATFHAAACVLYYDPFLAIKNRSWYWSRLSAPKRARLEYLIGLCSGYIARLEETMPKNGYTTLTPEPHPVALPTMIDYSALIRQMPSAMNTGSFMAFHPVPFDHQRLLQTEAYLKAFGSKLIKFEVEGHSLLVVLNLIEYLPNVTELKFVRSFVEYGHNNRSYGFAENDQPIMKAIVKAHANRFPGKLKTIDLDGVYMYSVWDLYVDLIRSMEPPRELIIRPVSHLQGQSRWSLARFPARKLIKCEIHIPEFNGTAEGRAAAADLKKTQKGDHELFLRRCRKLQVLYISPASFGSLRWAASERRQCLKGELIVQDDLESDESENEEEKNVKKRIEKQDESNCKRKESEQALVTSPTDPKGRLIALEKLTIGGHWQAAQDAMDGFRDTLVSIDFTHNLTEDSGVLNWDWDMPKLVCLKVANFGIQAGCLVHCPNLQTLEIGDVYPRPSQPLWVPPVTLTELTLIGLSYERMDLAMLGSLVNLEKLVCTQHSSNKEYRERVVVGDSLSGSPRVPSSGTAPLITTTSIPAIPAATASGVTPALVIQDWWFPNLKHAELVGAWAVQLQASLLAISPVLETCILKVIKRGEVCLEMSSFGIHLKRISKFPTIKMLILEGWCIRWSDQAVFDLAVRDQKFFPNASTVRINDFRRLGNENNLHPFYQKWKSNQRK